MKLSKFLYTIVVLGVLTSLLPILKVEASTVTYSPIMTGLRIHETDFGYRDYEEPCDALNQLDYNSQDPITYNIVQDSTNGNIISLTIDPSYNQFSNYTLKIYNQAGAFFDIAVNNYSYNTQLGPYTSPSSSNFALTKITLETAEGQTDVNCANYGVYSSFSLIEPVTTIFNQGGGVVTKSSLSNLAVYGQPQVSLLVDGQLSTNVAVGATPTLSWATSNVNPGNSCEAANSNSDSSWGGLKNGPSGGTQSVGPLNASGVFTYTIFCHGFGVDSNVATVQIIVGSTAAYSCSVDSPQSITVVRGSDASAVMQVHPLNGFTESVSFAGQVIPVGPNVPTIISPYSNNPQNTPYSSATAAVLHTTATTSLSTFQVIFTGTSSTTGMVVSCPIITLTVSPPDIDPPDNVQSNTTAGCGTATVTWNRPATGPTPESYQVYRSTRLLPATFVPVGSTVSDTGTGPYSLTDSDPLSLTGTNYYGVKSILGTQYSTLSISNPVIPEACAPSLNLSNKDLVKVNNNSQVPANPCNDSSDVYVLPSKSVFKTGSKVYFNVNVCNSGTRKLTGIQVVENDARNIENIQLVTPLGGCVLGGSGSGPYTLRDLNAPPTPGQYTVCTIQLSGNLKAPTDDPAGFLYRFWNKATINSNELNPKVVITIPYLFSDTGKPNRNETAP